MCSRAKATEQHYFDWMTGKTSGAAAMHIDPRHRAPTADPNRQSATLLRLRSACNNILVVAYSW
jgi:hypothetical protein